MTGKWLLGTVAASAIGCFAAGPAAAVTIRDDVADAAGGMPAYYDRDNRYPNVASLRVAAGHQQYCSGSLIDARTILTAAHCFHDEDGDPANTGETRGPLNIADLRGPGSEISFDPAAAAGTAGTAFSSVRSHEGYTGAIPTNDVALVALSRPITDLSAVHLATALPATGQTVIMVGYGTTVLASLGYDPADNEEHPEIVDDARRRVAQNSLDHVGEASALTATYPGTGVILASDIDIPQVEIDRLAPGESVDLFNSLGSAIALALEGGVEPGDSGGPLFILGTDGRLIQVGVATAINVPEGKEVLSSDSPFVLGYGAQNIWIGVPAFLDWLSSNAFLKEVSAVAGDGSWSSAAHWSGDAVPNNASGYVNGGAARYYNVSLNQSGTTVLDMNATIDSLTVIHEAAALTIGAPYSLTTEIGTTLSSGSIALAGGLTAPWLRLTGGTLAGSGRVTAAQGVTQSGGTLSPGGTGSIGTLTVAGPFTQTGGVLLAELTDSAADRLTVTGGAASLAGGLQVALLGETPPDAGSHFAVVGADSLAAASLADPAAVGAVTFTLERSATDLTVVVGRQALTAIGVDADQDGVAAALDGQRGNPAFEGVFDALDDLPQGQIQAALEEMSEVSTTAGVTARAGSAQFLGAASQRVAAVRLGLADNDADSRLALQALSGMPFSSDGLAEASWRAADAAGPARLARPRFAGPVDGLGSGVAAGPAIAFGAGAQIAGLGGSDTRWGGWLQPYGTRTLRRGNDPGSRYDATLGGGAAGIDYRLGESLIVGASLGYARAEVGYLDSASRNRMRSYQAGLYGGWWNGPWSVEGGLGLALNRYENNRAIAFGTLSTAAEGRYDGTEWSGYAEGGRRFDLAVAGQQLELTPSASLQALRVTTDSYAETGAGVLNLSVGADRVTSLKSGLGAALAMPVVLADGRRLKPEIRGRWLHEFADTSVAVDSRFAAAGGAAFEVSSDSLGRDAAVLGAGLEAELGPRLGLAAGYDVQVQSGLTVHAVTAKLRVAF